MNSSKGRRQHYAFAHAVLPRFFYSDPRLFTSYLAQDKSRFLRFYWDKIGEKFDDPGDRVDGSGLNGEVRLLDNQVQAGLITLPTPQRVPEAYFVMTFYHADFNAAPLARYYTLEYGWNIHTNTPYTVFCGWTADGTHFNKGAGPEPDLETFLKVAQADLDGSPAPPR